MKKLFAFITLSFAFATAVIAAPQDAVNQVRQNAETILKIINQDDGKNSEEIKTRAEEYAMPFFDFQRMTALAVGLPWRQASDTQKQALADAFKNRLIRIYAGTMLQYKSAQVNIKDNPVVRNNGRIVMVASEIKPDDNKPAVAIDYTMYESNGKYRIYDVKVEGQSLVTIYRNQFGEIIRQKGIDGLIHELNQDNGKQKAQS